ncbi:response regulator [Gemmobacter sp. 24YEA27]|uniref:response regulator transcription factor n=1 Tax=Gemmobacter sp. 24YEA27 TaxID=3040672 RepID=UPI0024B326CB|nr:response regulator [Gemmobacter sp. 24YEA27]
MIYLVDDDAAVSQAMTLLLRTYHKEVTGFPDGPHLLAHLDTARPGVLLLDLRMPVISGLQLIDQLGQRGIHWPAIMVTGHGDVEACRRAFRAGVTDFLTKPVDEHALMDAITRAEAQLAADLQRDETRQLLSLLTQREAEVLEMVARGLGSKDIATALHLSVRTVDSHRAAIAAKLGTAAVAEQTRAWISLHP